MTKNLPANSGDAGDADLIIWLVRSTGARNDSPLQYSCRDKSMDRAAWWATVHWVAKSQTQLSEHTHTHMHSLIYIKIICKLQTQNHFLHNCKLNYHYTYLKLYMHTCISISIYLSIYITVIYCVHYSSFINWPLKYSIVGTRIQIL